MNNSALVDIIIPTFNNRDYLMPCLQSMIAQMGSEGLYRIIVVNNGHKDSCNWIDHPSVEVITTGNNLGWEGGIHEGLKHSKAEFVMFANDDIFVPASSHNWVHRMLQWFRNPEVSSVGPSSNCVMGMQNIWANPPAVTFTTMFLIGFCVLHRRSAFDEIGGMDLKLPGGDDFDWSIRLRKAGYSLVVDRGVFVYHHGFKTGERLHGSAAVSNGWNSWESMQKTNTALIKKHGFKVWYETVQGAYMLPESSYTTPTDSEGDFIRTVLDDSMKVVDLGCGPNKTVSWAVGVDMIGSGEDINSLNKATSVADIVADVTKELPFKDGEFDVAIARHILEHCINPVTTIREWMRIVADDGKLIVAVPNQDLANTVPMNMEHVHAYTPQNMTDLVEALGLKVSLIFDPKNGVSFITVITR